MASQTSIYNTCLLLFLLSFNLPREIKAFVIMGRHTVNVKNELPNDFGQLEVHCASKDDDLGHHFLSSSEAFSWSFRANFWETTLYFCHFWSGVKTKAFVVFNAGWDADEYHHTLIYSVKSDGFYLSYDDEPSSEPIKVQVWDG
ncbi:hypothetical protein ABFX02_07G066800 [Erythranthe guttata]